MKGLLAKIFPLGNNLEAMEGTNENPPYLIAHGQIVIGQQTARIRTAISIRNQQDAEFSTNIGQIPNSSLGLTVTEALNHKFDGKFVTFVNESSSSVDVVYTTRQPTALLDTTTLKSELERHAHVQVITAPIFQDVNRIQVNPQLTFSQVKIVAQDIVATNLDLQNRLRDKHAPIQYPPKPTSKGRG
jgi:hypothetical protein